MSVEEYTFTNLQDENTSLMIDNITTPIVSAPTGCMDQASGDALVVSIDEHIGSNDVHHIIDLRAIDKVDARTIRIMIKIKRRISQIGGSIRLVIENSTALRYIKLTALGRVFGVYSTPAAALAGYESDDRNAAQSELTADDGAKNQNVV